MCNLTCRCSFRLYIVLRWHTLNKEDFMYFLASFWVEFEPCFPSFRYSTAFITFTSGIQTRILGSITLLLYVVLLFESSCLRLNISNRSCVNTLTDWLRQCRTTLSLIEIFKASELINNVSGNFYSIRFGIVGTLQFCGLSERSF